MQTQHYFLLVGSIPMPFSYFEKLSVEIKLLEYVDEMNEKAKCSYAMLDATHEDGWSYIGTH